MNFDSPNVTYVADLYCGKGNHDKMYRLAILKRLEDNSIIINTYTYELWSFYKARKASKWNSKMLQSFGHVEYLAKLEFTKIYRQKIGKGYEALKTDSFRQQMTSGSDVPSDVATEFLSVNSMLWLANISELSLYECVDDFAERRGFVVGCEYRPLSINSAKNLITIRNDAGEMFDLPIEYFKRVS